MSEKCKHEWSLYDTDASGLEEEVIGNFTYPQDITIEAECVFCGRKASRKGLVQWEEWEGF